MKDTNFEKYSRAHSFWQEWQGAADRAGDVDTYLDDLIAAAAPQWQGVDTDEFMDMVRGREPETFSEAVADISPDWDFVVNGAGLGKSDLMPKDMYSVYTPSADFSQVLSTDWFAVFDTRLPVQSKNDLVINLT